jgi:hypothetical protein
MGEFQTCYHLWIPNDIQAKNWPWGTLSVKFGIYVHQKIIFSGGIR